MGTYISQSDVENVYGTANVAAWSVIEPGSDPATANTTRITAAIAYAEQYVEDRFRGFRYALPFSGAGVVVIDDWCAKIAGAWLYESRGKAGGRDEEAADQVASKKRAALGEMDSYLAGMRKLDLTLADNGGTAPIVC
jgi:uncharacterized protein DUF1320